METWKINALNLMLLHHWLYQIVFLRFQPKFGNSVTDGLISFCSVDSKAPIHDFLSRVFYTTEDIFALTI